MNKYRIPKGTTVEVVCLDMNGILEPTGETYPFVLPQDLTMKVKNKDEGDAPVYTFNSMDPREGVFAFVWVRVQKSDLVKINKGDK